MNTSSSACPLAPEHPLPEAAHPLVLQNSGLVPVGHIPLLRFSSFSHWLHSSLHSGCRVVAFFPLPPDCGGSSTSESFQLVAILAKDSTSALHLASTTVGKEYSSFTPRFPELHLFERALHENYGIVPQGHPWLKPVRFSHPQGPHVGETDFFAVQGEDVHEVAVGPIHAGVIECGHFRFQCLGEVVMHLEISLGYHHRGVIRLLQQGPNSRTLPLLGVTAGDSTVAHTWAFCTLMESLNGTTPSPQGQLLRAFALELERLANHTGDMGALAGDTGFLSTQSFCGRLRGDWLNMTALLCGNRFGRNLLCPGGVAYGADQSLLTTLKDRLLTTAARVQGAIQLLWDSPSFMARVTGIGPVPSEEAKAIGLVGPAARASGLARDVRHTHPLPGLPAPPSLCTHSWGDVHARARQRHEEIRASVAFCTRLLDDFFAAGGIEHITPPAFAALAPRHLAISLIEGWRGEVCHVAVTNSTGQFAAYEIIDPSFHNWMGLSLALREQQISDFPLCNKSFNLSYCGHDL